MASITTQSLDELFSRMPTGSLDRAILNNLRSFNHLQTPSMLPSQRDMPGYTFFVRPQMNMQRDNLRNVRKLSMLLSNVSTSMQTFMRCLLDPRLMTGVSYSSGSIPAIECPILDNQNAFIPFLTNNFTTMSGWPSIAVPTFKSKPGLYNESFSMVDGRVANSEAFDLTVNFRNTRGNPVVMLFYVWALYMSYVFEGKLVPYLDFITENEIDYNTRIYRVITDHTRQVVTGITACHAAFPVGIPIGDIFDVQGDKPYIDAQKDVSITFSCVGVDYFDDILVKEFNDTVGIFNSSMKDNRRSLEMMRVPKTLVQYFNFTKAYPRINGETRELEWWVSFQDYSQRLSGVAQQLPEANSETFEGE